MSGCDSEHCESGCYSEYVMTGCNSEHCDVWLSQGVL